MKEQFDKRLVEKIKGSFENYEEPFNPKEWEKFSNAYFKKEKPKPLWVWVTLISGVAASLIIGFLVWPGIVDGTKDVYVSQDLDMASPKVERKDSTAPLYERYNRSDAGDETAVTEREQTVLAPDIKEEPMPAPSAPTPSATYMGRDLRTDVNITPVLPSNMQALGQFRPLPRKDLGLAEIMEREGAKPAGDIAYTLPQTHVIPVIGKPFVTSDPLPEKNLALGEVLPRAGGQVTGDPELKVLPPKEPLKEEEAQKIINTWAMADMPSIMDKRKNDSGVKWGLVMAPQAASNTTMGLNLGGGLMSEISLSRRLKLDVGVTFARQSLVPGQGQNVAMAMNNSPGRTTADQLQNASAFSQSRGAALLGSNMVMPASPTYELTFANLDIPINLKYKVMDNPQSGLYLISGLSSMIYLNQSTTETFNISYLGINQANAFSANQVQTLTTEITPQDGESTVDLGRMLNLSFGYEYKLTNGTFLSVEPFYKLPIGNMTFVDQQFSIGGVNLRMNFQFKK